MTPSGLDKHQLAGLDHRERGFNRAVEFERVGETYRAKMRYESLLAMSDPAETQDAALMDLIRTLQAQGYRQLRSQMSFRNGLYLGSQELWVEYPDPPQPAPEPSGILARLRQWLRPHGATQTERR